MTAETKEARLEVAGSEVERSFLDKGTIDIHERDPNEMNAHLKITFPDIFAEPEPTTFSFDPIWITSYKVFTGTKLWCYRILTAIFAIPAMVFWGIIFAFTACCTIWCCWPVFRCWSTCFHFVKLFYTTIIEAICLPFWRAVGHCLAHINVQMNVPPPASSHA